MFWPHCRHWKYGVAHNVIGKLAIARSDGGGKILIIIPIKILRMLILNGNHLLFIHQQNGSIVQNVDSEGMPISTSCGQKQQMARHPFVDSEGTPISTNCVVEQDRNNKWHGTHLLICQMGQPSRL